MPYGDDLQGYLSDQEFEDVLCQLVQSLQRSGIYWEFPGQFLEDGSHYTKGSPSRLGAWGHTPQEAWENLHRFPYAEGEGGLTSDQWDHYVRVHGLSSETSTVDSRRFPDVDPEFTVLDRD